MIIASFYSVIWEQNLRHQFIIGQLYAKAPLADVV